MLHWLLRAFMTFRPRSCDSTEPAGGCAWNWWPRSASGGAGRLSGCLVLRIWLGGWWRAECSRNVRACPSASWSPGVHFARRLTAWRALASCPRRLQLARGRTRRPFGVACPTTWRLSSLAIPDGSRGAASNVARAAPLGVVASGAGSGNDQAQDRLRRRTPAGGKANRDAILTSISEDVGDKSYQEGRATFEAAARESRPSHHDTRMWPSPLLARSIENRFNYADVANATHAAGTDWL